MVGPGGGPGPGGSCRPGPGPGAYQGRAWGPGPGPWFIVVYIGNKRAGPGAGYSGLYPRAWGPANPLFYRLKCVFAHGRLFWVKKTLVYQTLTSICAPWHSRYIFDKNKSFVYQTLSGAKKIKFARFSKNAKVSAKQHRSELNKTSPGGRHNENIF